MKMGAGRAAAALATFAAFGLAATSAGADAAFYKGKQVRFLTMGSPGGGFDRYTRTIGAFLEKRTGAKFITTNEPGAGGLVALSRILSAPADGLAILLIGGEALVTTQLFGVAKVNYDVRKLVYLARLSAEDKVAVVGKTSPFHTVADLKKSDRPAVWAGSGKTDTNTDFAAIMCYALAAKCKLITGYKGTGGMNMAIQRGEADGRVLTDESAALYGPSSGMRVVTVLSRDRSHKFPNVPTIFEVGGLSQHAARLVDWRAGIARVGRIIIAKPGTPAGLVNYLRKELAVVLQDPAYIAQVKKVRLAAGYGSAEQVQATVEKSMTALDAKALAEVKEIALNRYYTKR